MCCVYLVGVRWLRLEVALGEESYCIPCAAAWEADVPLVAVGPTTSLAPGCTSLGGTSIGRLE